MANKRKAALMEMAKEQVTPINLIHIKLWHYDKTMLTSPDGKRVEVDLEAIRKLLER